MKKLAGQRFYKLTATDILQRRGKISYRKCLCDCGNETWIPTSALLSGHTKSCGCFLLTSRHLALGQAARNEVLDDYKRGAKTRNLTWNLTDVDFDNLTQDICFYCNRQPRTCRKGRGNNGDFIYNGIDRIDSSKGYVIGNVVSCCEICNRAKSDLSFDDFVGWLRDISWRFMEKPFTVSQNSPAQRCALITGVTGQDGSYLAEFLLEKGYRVIGMARRNSQPQHPWLRDLYAHKNFVPVYGNMQDAASLWRILDQYRPDEIYNLAAQSHVRVSFDTPEETFDVVAMGTLRLLNAARTLVPNAKIYQAGSSEQFGFNPARPQNEETAFMPASPYACAKVAAHNICVNYREAYKMFIAVGILHNHESPRRGDNFVTRKITIAAAKIKTGTQDKLKLGNLEAKRDWGYAKEYVEFMWRMLQHDRPEDFVIATGESHSVREFVEAVFKHAGLDWKEYVEFDATQLRPHEVPHLEGDASKAKRVLGWEPTVRFEDLAKLMFEADLKRITEL